jgi:hypothetical protein
MNIVGRYVYEGYPKDWCRISHHPNGYYVEWSKISPEIKNEAEIKQLIWNLDVCNYKRDEIEAAISILIKYEV